MCLLLAGHKRDLITVLFWKKKKIGKARNRVFENQLKLGRAVMVVISSISCFGFLELFLEKNGQEIRNILMNSQKHMTFGVKFRTAADEVSYFLNYLYNLLSILAVKNSLITFST